MNTNMATSDSDTHAPTKDSDLSIEEVLKYSPYAQAKKEKRALISPILRSLTQHHRHHCASYSKILESLDSGRNGAVDASEVDAPFLPVRLFKHHKLCSVEDSKIYKVLTSSGTTGQEVSKIYLDQVTAGYQTKAMVGIFNEFIGKTRLPMLIVDHPEVLKDRTSFSARGAGILGMMNFGRRHTYLLNSEDMSLNFDVLGEFLRTHGGQPILIFGFTFMVWKYLIQALKDRGEKIDLSSGILVHSGGWKKLQDQAVSNEDFKSMVKTYTNITRVHNFYGMVEQVGSIFVECEHGNLHTPVFSDIRILDPLTWNSLPEGEVGIIEVSSILPHSYPGHVLLTEDLGRINGEDCCPCGRLGKIFSVLGRVPKSEVRGCSDTHEVAAT